MIFFGEGSWKEFIGLNVVSSAILVQELVVVGVDHIDADELVNDFSEFWQSNRSHPIRAIDSSAFDALPFEIGGCTGEVTAKFVPKFMSNQFRVNYFFLHLHIAKVY